MNVPRLAGKLGFGQAALHPCEAEFIDRLAVGFFDAGSNIVCMIRRHVLIGID
jgi:hypothetical protein